MLTLFGHRKVNGEDTAPPSLGDAAIPSECDPTQALADFVVALTEGRYDSALDHDTEERNALTDALLTLRDRLQDGARQGLCATVAFSMNASQAMASIAHVTDTIRRADERTQGMASAIEEMTASIQQISGSGNLAAEQSEQALSTSQDGMQRLEAAVRQMESISDTVASIDECAGRLVAASEQISGILSTIDALANQTNLLALNATIEAARAGQHGKGFAVVATEVKTLATQTAEATEDIRQRVQALEQEVSALTDASTKSQEAAADGKSAIDEARDRMGTIGGQVGTVSEQMREISNMLTEQSGAVQEISTSVTSIADLSRRNKENAEDAIGAVREMESTVEERFADLDRQAIPDMVLYRAKSDHYLWKKRLAEMLVGLNSLKPEELADHHSCRLGKWYDQVDEQWFKDNGDFQALLGPHEQVHTFGKAAAEAYHNGRPEEAWQAYNEMDKASLEVIRLLDALIDQRQRGRAGH